MANPPSDRLLLLAIAAGVSVANIYYAQPLAAAIAADLHVSQGALGLPLMLAQLGYGLGMLLLVPLGDGRERRGLMVATSAAATLTLLLVAAAPGHAALSAAFLALGFASSLPQMIVPYAVGMVAPEARGRAIGTVMGGLLTGILLSRTASGALGDLVGWRWTYVLAATVMAVLTVVLRVALPPQRPAQALGWGTILGSLVQVLRGEPLLRRHGLVGALGFAAFSAFWSTLSFHLASFGYGSRTAGLFGAVGVVGVAVAPIVGRLSGRIPARRINALALVSVALSFAVFGGAATSLIGIGLGVVLLDAGVQANHLANQTVIYGLRPELRNRLNAVYMVIYFSGGAIGTVVATAAWERAGWTGVCVAGAALAAAGLAPLLGRRPVGRRPPRGGRVMAPGTRPSRPRCRVCERGAKR